MTTATQLATIAQPCDDDAYWTQHISTLEVPRTPTGALNLKVQWSQFWNIWQNAAIRTLLYRMARLVPRIQMVVDINPRTKLSLRKRLVRRFYVYRLNMNLLTDCKTEQHSLPSKARNHEEKSLPLQVVPQITEGKLFAIRNNVRMFVPANNVLFLFMHP